MVQHHAVFSNLLQLFCRLPRLTVFLVSSLLTAAVWTVVCLLSQQPGPRAVIQFLLCALAMLMCTLAPLIHAHYKQYSLPFSWIFLSAVLLRLLSLTGDPLFEDDHYRYMWDGYMTATTGDPYSLPPEAFFDRDVPDAFEAVLSSINYPEIATVYGPVTEWIFAAGYLIKAASVWPLQLLAGISDLLVLTLLWHMGARAGLLLYAWSPLILKEFSLTAHPDIHAIALMLLACMAMHKARAVLAGIAIGLAFATKIFAVLVIPYLLLGSGTTGNQWQLGWRMLAGAAVCLVLVTAGYGTIEIWTPEGLRAMADSWLFNAPLYTLLLNVAEFQTIKILLISCFLVAVLITLTKRLMSPASSPDRINPAASGTGYPLWLHSASAFRGDWLFAAFVLSLPVVNPWYVAWILPFAALYPRWWSWSAGYAVLLSYSYGSYIAATGATALQLSPVVIGVEYAIVLLVPLIAWGVRRKLRRTTPVT